MTDTVRRIVIRRIGGPEVLDWEEVALPPPGPGEARVRHHAIGLNFIEIYHRTGLYKAELPSGLGTEAAGVVEAVGEGVTSVAEGDRVAYATGPLGAYAEARVMPASHLVKLPDEVGFEAAAALTLKGLTVQYLFRRTTPIAPDATILLHAAAGGVGLIACQWARSEGLRVIGTAGTEEKRALAREAGAWEAIDSRGDIAAEVRRLTDGRGVDVVMDSVGRDTFLASLDSLRPVGMLISFGNASGKVEPFDLQLLAQKGALQVTRPTLFVHAGQPGVLQEMADDLFGKVVRGEIRAHIGQRRPLAEVAEAQRALAGRETTGATVLIP